MALAGREVRAGADEHISIAIDVAASHFSRDDYGVDFLLYLVDRYPVVSIEDGLAEDDWTAAVASGAGQIKVGSVRTSERLVKYNRLLRIGQTAKVDWAGGAWARRS